METTLPRPRKTPAEIIEAFGGPTLLARRLGLGVSAVSNWCLRGAIPDAWHLRLIVLARSSGVDLSESDLLPEVELGRAS